MPRAAVAAALGLLLLFAWLTGIRLAFSLFYALGLLLLLAYLWSRAATRHLRVERTSPSGVSQVGHPFEERFEVSNDSWIPFPFIELTDQSSLAGYRPDRVFSLKGHRTRRWNAPGTFARRGLFVFGPTELRTGDPFGLFPRVIPIANATSVVVHPQIRAMHDLRSLASSSSGEEHLFGPALDVPPNATTIREHTPTDSVKRIHWASSARLGRLMSRAYETREGGDMWILLDLQRGIHAGDAPESTLEVAISFAASLAHEGLRRGIAVGLVGNDAAGTTVPAARGEQQRNRLMEALTLAEDDGPTPLATLLRTQATHWRNRGGLVVLTPSADPEWVEALVDVGARGQRNLVVYLDPTAFGGSGLLSINARWRQALEWWIVRSSKPAGEEGSEALADVVNL